MAIRNVLLGFVAAAVLLLATATIYVVARQDLRYDLPFPAISASTDSSVIARGRYLVQDVAVCVGCHGDPESDPTIRGGHDVPLSGGRRWDILPGTFFAGNITPDTETGIGGMSDGAIARTLRNGVKHDGRVLLPFMEFQGLSDADLEAVISYLRTLPPVRHRVSAHRPNWIGRIVLATALSRPAGPKTPPSRISPTGPTIENGRYLVESVALCGGCHTQRDPKTGEATGPALAGARAAVQDHQKPTRFWSPRNLTSASKTGRLAMMSEADFVTRFRSGRLIVGSPMPWENFQRLGEDDLRAIYRYLKTVPPVENDPGPIVVEKR